LHSTLLSSMIALRMAFNELYEYSNQLLRLIVPLLNSDFFKTVGTLGRLGKRILGAKAHEGMYEVLELDVRLELNDIKGQQAVLYKRERVRFLQDNIIAYQDKAWGDGEIVADYKCTPGVAVDRYRDGYRWRVLISLRETKRRGDTEEFHIERRIRNGFTKDVESLQTDVDHAMQKLSVSIVFPQKRSPKHVLLIEQNTTRAVSLGSENRNTLPDGRQQVRWNSDQPRLFEAYILRWAW
jgi:hypothetical protein